MELSNRLQAIAEMVSHGTVIADVGTDHGYIPIYLVKQGICDRAYAMDVREGPLSRAREHIRQEKLDERITLRLSDGMKELKAGEADGAVIAGMGGGLIIHILEQSIDIAKGMRELILGPQSEVMHVRGWLSQHDFRILDEEMIEEDGKYYPIIKITYQPEQTEKTMNEMQMRFGPVLLEKKHPVLKRFLKHEIDLNEKISQQLAKQTTETAAERKKEIEEKVRILTEAFALM